MKRQGWSVVGAVLGAAVLTVPVAMAQQDAELVTRRALVQDGGERIPRSVQPVPTVMRAPTQEEREATRQVEAVRDLPRDETGRPVFSTGRVFGAPTVVPTPEASPTAAATAVSFYRGPYGVPTFARGGGLNR